MANPTFFPEGNTGVKNDTKRRTWAKICGKEFDNSSAEASLAPKPGDTLRVLKAKTEYILSGTTSTF